MVYLTHYKQNAVYEPAEGGYYVAETYAVESEQMSLRQAKKAIKALWQECLKDNEEEGNDYWVQNRNFRNRHGEFGFNPGFKIMHNGEYIGDDEFYCIDRVENEHENTYRGYC